MAGVAGFMRALDPSLTNGVIVGRLARTADVAGTSDQTGNGRVNMARAVADTTTDPVVPLGAPGGGPFVGPYLAAAGTASSGAGSMKVSPFSVRSGTSSGFTFTFTSDNGKNFPSGSQMTLAIPAGWTAPQSSNSANPGYVGLSIPSGGCSSASLTTVSATTITVTMACLANTSFVISYNNATAPSTPGIHTFTTKTKAGAGGTLTEITTSPGNSPGSPTIIANAAPSVSTIAPAQGDRLTTIDLVITGSNFINGETTLTMNPATGLTLNAWSVKSATEIDANVTIALTTPTGTMNFVITNPDAGGGTSAVGFQITNPAPTLSASARQAVRYRMRTP